MRRAWIVLAFAACLEPRLDEREQANTQQCGTQVVEGVDVYGGTGTIDWARVKASGREFAFIKATQGTYNKQASFSTQWSGAAAAGLLRSAYHFFDGTNDGVAQANWFLAELAAGGGMQPGDLPPLLDLECPTSSNQATTQSDCERAGASGWVDTPTLLARTFDWLATVEQATGRKPLIYSYPSWFPDVMASDPRLAAYPLFIATYATCASVPPPWTSAVFWQYSASATVPGITAAADVDRFFGTHDDLVAYATPADAGVDAGEMPPMESGCGCQTRSPAGALWLLVVLLACITPRRLRARFGA